MHYPLTDDDALYLRQFVEQAALFGSQAVVTLEPQIALGNLTTDDADTMAQLLADLRKQLGTEFYVRFGPEMNGSWYSWGQQPEAYVSAFRTVADSVHRAVPSASMLWTPSYGAGYPFGNARGAVPGTGNRDTAALDTDGDGTVTGADNPYSPYYPGDDAVDWVGLSLYHWGDLQNFGTNSLPEPGKFAAELDGTYGYPDTAGAGRNFYQTYVRDAAKPMFVETAAFYQPNGTGSASEIDIKSAWWEQIFGAETRSAYPGITMVTWLEVERAEDEVDGALVDWRATATPTMASALKSALARDGVDTGPVTAVHDPEAAGAATKQIYESDPGKTDQMGWIVFCIVVAALMVLASALATRFAPTWRYPNEKDPRDLRVDWMRGWVMVTLIVLHVEMAGALNFFSRNIVGAITGAELFVGLSGIVMGMVYSAAMVKAGWWPVSKIIGRRALRLYLTSLVVVVSVYVISRIPGIDGSVITTFADRGTGAGGEVAAGQVYDLYPNASQLFAYPPPWYAVRDLLLIRMGPWVFNIMGLFVILSLLVPILLWMLRRRLVLVVLTLSAGLYVVDYVHPTHLFPSQFEDSFPLLTWQVLFVYGLAVGYYRRSIIAWGTGRWGRVVIGTFVGVYAGAVALLWLSSRFDFALPLVPDGLYSSLYEHMYQRVSMQPGRLLDLVLVVLTGHIFLTAFWKPANKALGWLYIPLGQASLYVFIMHVYFVLAVGNIPNLDRSNVWIGTALHCSVIGILWVMVKKKFLFKFVPT
ncbi:OpgC domain-containing protein [Actinomycetes bacterium M1A6_2h]